MDKQFLFETTGSNTRRTQRPVNPDRIPSDVSFELEKSSGVRPSVAFMPHKYAPTIKKIHTVSNEDFAIAIPKGTIVSAIPVVNEAAYINGFANSGQLLANASSGDITVGIDNNSTTLFAGAQNPIHGYGKVINAAVIANGGVEVQDLYKDYDYTAGTRRIKQDGTYITNTDTFTRGANVPLGIAHEDIYINREGQFLNASESGFQLFDSILSDFLIAVPFVIDDTTVDGTQVQMGVTQAGGVQTMEAGYAAMHAEGIACLIGADRNDVTSLGNLVASDLNGKFVPQWTNLNCVGANPGAGITAVRNVQTVGTIFAVDTKFPKDIEDTTQNYPNNHAGGTNTYGIPLDLYRLMYYVYTGIGVTVNYDNLIEGINSGNWGIAWINLHVN
jgi:hypothetical protein